MSTIAIDGPGTTWVRRAVAWGAGLQTARVARRLGRAGGAAAEQEAVLRELLPQFAGTEFGRQHGLARGTTAAEFARTVPLRRYEEFAPWIERMKFGESDVLWPGRCSHFAVSSGTTAGRTKYLPVTAEMLDHFRRTGLDSLCYFAARVGDDRVFRGRHLFLGGSTALTPISADHPPTAWSGDLSGIAALNLPRWAENFLYEPGRDIALMADWPAKLRAIVERTVRREISLVAGIPSWLLVLAGQLRAYTGRATLRDIWPGLQCLVHGGVPLGPFEAELRAVAGPGVALHEVYPASEGFIAAQDTAAGAGLRLMTDAGIYYEFLPWAKFDETRLADLGAEAVGLGDVEPGVDYVLLLTTPAGLCRYVIGDVVRFLSIDPPRLVYAGRTRLQLSAFGEHVIEKELTDSLCAVLARHGLAAGNFHVAPRFAEAGVAAARGRHEWWLELKAAGGDGSGTEELAAELDGELQARNEDYEAKRRGGGLLPPVVRQVPEGTFERWLRERGKWGGQNKVPRCRSDRVVADELARVATAVA
jgi:hypothetical protein